MTQMAVKLVIEPIFEADFRETSYGFRPKKSAHDAVDEVAHALNQARTEVIDADLSKYGDTIPHAKLMIMVAERISDGAVLQLIHMWLKAQVMEVDKNGTKRTIGGGNCSHLKQELRRAGSSHRCWPMSTCTCWTGYGSVGGYRNVTERVSSA